jgi:cytidylate kinase
MSATHKPVIAIDGPAASGKGTLARKIAAELGFAYLDTGALYRGTAFEVFSTGAEPRDEAAALRATQTLKTKLLNPATRAATLSSPALRSDEIGLAASIVADMTAVREALKDLQKSFAANPGEGFAGAVLDGRDIGTVICPDADVKLFVTADLEVRAQRRLKELQSRGISATYGAVLKDMRERDARDKGRKAAPMKPADDAELLDTSALSQDETVQKALQLIRAKLS